MPSITILAPNYFPETNAGAKRVTRLAEHLAASGWDVEVFTVLPHHPQNRIYDGFEKLGGTTLIEKTVTVTRVRPWLVSKHNLALRLIAEVWACLKLIWRVLFKAKRSDVYLASSPYMFLGPAGLLIARLHRRPFVWDVRDLTWLYPRASGKRTFGLDRPLEALMRWTARSSAALTTATEGLYEYFRERPDLAMTVPNGASADALELLNQKDALVAEYPGRPRAVYIGLFGYNHKLSTVLDAALLLPNVEFVFVGDGPDRPLLEQAARELPNVEVLSFRPLEDLVSLYHSATVLISHVRKDSIFKWTQPAKLWEYMASSRPVVHAGEGEVVDIIESERIGITVPPEDSKALAAAIEKVVCDRRLATELGSRGRQYVELKRNSATIFTAMEELLKTVARH